ncbi:fatty acid hydroxylase domain-containing protein 2-like isoform X2 [Littorina saxatilis]|uniref:fatty acid hydroxylase domain-containing protein 2-like isoform X2 n=1 Tax=Littorina saxatilis TaxID=31220 RepID=UPI0038B41E47
MNELARCLSNLIHSVFVTRPTTDQARKVKSTVVETMISMKEELWGHIYNAFGQDHHLLGVYGTLLQVWTVFWIPNLLLMVVDVTGRPTALLRYKVQPDKNRPVSKSKLWTAVRVAIFNQVVVSLPFTLGLYYTMEWRGCGFHPHQLPTFCSTLLQLAFFVVIEEIGFYYSHRLLHQPTLYRHVHKLHHEWTAPVGVVAIYAHPVEHVVANLLPAVTGPVLLGSHLAVLWLWMTIVIVNTTVHHSGYHFPLLTSPQFHDFHHLKFNCCYGVLGILDSLHGTDKPFKSSKASLRHRPLLSLRPISQLIPDADSTEKSQ